MAEITQAGIRRYLDGQNSMDPDLIHSAFSKDAEIRYPGLEVMDRDGFRAYVKQVQTLVASVDFQVSDFFVNEYGYGGRWTINLVTKTGQKVRLDGIDSWIIGPDESIQRMDVYYDRSVLLAALQS